MKKILSVIMAAILGISFVGCSSGKKEGTKNENAIKVGIIQIMEHPSLNTIRESFVDELKSLSNVPIEIDYKNAQGEQSNLNSIAQEFVGEEKDLIVAIATPSAQAVVATTQDIPVVFSAVTDPQSAGILQNNVTGTSDMIPVDKIIELGLKLTPNIKTMGLIYNSGEVNSVSVINKAKKYLEDKGLKFEETTITNTSELQQAAISLSQKCDAIFTPIDNTVASAMPVLSDIAIQQKLPLYVGADSMVNDGGFATVGINYTVLGKETAKIANEIINGKSPKDIPYVVLDKFSTVINKTVADKIGVVIPEDIASNATLVD